MKYWGARRKKITPFGLFFLVSIAFYGYHMVTGYLWCVESEYANCPGFGSAEIIDGVKDIEPEEVIL
jgi:hypothetical protein